MVWDLGGLLRRSDPPTPNVSRSSTSSTASTASIPLVYDSRTSRVESGDWKTFEHTNNLLEAEAEGTSLTANLRINIGSAVKPILAHFAYVDLSNLNAEVRNERRQGRINQVYVRV